MEMNYFLGLIYVETNKKLNMDEDKTLFTSTIFFSSTKATSISAWHIINSTAPAPKGRNEEKKKAVNKR